MFIIGTGLLIPRSPFTRVIKQISQELTGNSAFRFVIHFTQLP